MLLKKTWPWFCHKKKEKKKKLVDSKTCLSLTGDMPNFRVISTLNSITDIFSLKES